MKLSAVTYLPDPPGEDPSWARRRPEAVCDYCGRTSDEFSVRGGELRAEVVCAGCAAGENEDE